MMQTVHISPRRTPHRRRGMGEGYAANSATAGNYASAGAGLVSSILSATKKPEGQQVVSYNGFQFGSTQDLEKRGVTSTVLQTAGGAAAAFTFGISLILTLIPAEAYEKTVARLFKNGLNFKCWGSSWAPSKAKAVLETEIPVIKNEAQKVLKAPLDQFENAVNDFMIFFYAIHSTDRDWLKTSAKDCTREGLEILIGALDLAKTQMTTAFTEYAKKMGGNLQRNGTVKKVYPPEESGRHSLTQDVEQYRFTPPKQTIVPTTNNLQPMTGGQSEAGFGGTGIILFTALVAGTYLYKKNKN